MPFHFWTPDVYQGAPTPVTAFMASVGKVGGVRRDAARARRRPAVLPRRLAPGRSGCSPCCRSSSARCWPSCRPTSSGCSPTRRSATPGSSSSASRRPATAPASRRSATACRASLLYLLLYTVLVVGTFAVVAARRPHRRRRHRPRRVPGPRPGAVRRWPLGAHRVPAGPGRRAAHVGLRRQVRRDPGRGRGAQLRDRDHRDGVRGDRRVPVPADHGQRVARGRCRRDRARTGAVLDRPGDLAAAGFTLFVGVLPGWLLDAAETVTRYAR